MLRWLEQNKARRRTATDLYEKIVAQARSASLYRDHAVPDTMEGRFEMIVLHLVLVLQRLKAEGAPGQRLGQMLMERLIADMDDALRQIGIGDMGVPRRIQKTAAALQERAHSYGEALEMLANEQRCAYFDLTSPWREYIVSSKLHPHLFYRDIVHANEYGEQILSKILMAFWMPK